MLERELALARERRRGPPADEVPCLEQREVGDVVVEEGTDGAVLEPANAGPAGYGLETAHHGPDAGKPGKSDGCYAVAGNPVDGSPAIN